MAITKKSLQTHDAYNQRSLLSVFSLWGLPPTMLDIGSGSGITTHTARQLGVNAMGLDILAEPPDIQHDLNTPINLNRKFDLIITIETAEHIQNEANFLSIIRDHIAPNGLMIFTAAMAGQLGDGHINCQNPNYWRDKFYAMGITYDNNATCRLGLMWAQTTGGLSSWLVPNLQVFRYG